MSNIDMKLDYAILQEQSTKLLADVAKLEAVKGKFNRLNCVALEQWTAKAADVFANAAYSMEMHIVDQSVMMESLSDRLQSEAEERVDLDKKASSAAAGPAICS